MANDSASAARDHWDKLQPEIVLRIAECIPQNEVACTLLLLNKETAMLLRNLPGKTRVVLSQPVPHHAFAWKWGLHGCHAAQWLGVRQRTNLLELTARSGVVANMEVALEALSGLQCRPLVEEVFVAAAAGGSQEMLTWLVGRGCPRDEGDGVVEAASAGHLGTVRWLVQLDSLDWGDGVCLTDEWTKALWAAARGGHTAVCEGLLADGPQSSIETVSNAAWSGNLALTLRLLREMTPEAWDHWLEEGAGLVLLTVAMIVFDLPAVLQVYEAACCCLRAARDEEDWDDPFLHSIDHETGERVHGHYGEQVFAGALISHTPDWRAKLEWLAAKGIQMSASDVNGSVDMGDVSSTLSSFNWYRKANPYRRANSSWMWTKGCHDPTAKVDCVAYGIMELPDALERVAFLHESGLMDPVSYMRSAAYQGNVSVLHYLQERALANWSMLEPISFGAGANLDTVGVVMAAGRLNVLRTMCSAAFEADLRLLRWLAASEAGRAALQEARLQAAQDPKVGMELEDRAAASGSVEVMEWLQEQGFPLAFNQKTFSCAAWSGSRPMLEWLAARGCAMGAKAYLEAAGNDDLSTLHCLKQLGCPWDEGTGTFITAVLDVHGEFTANVLDGNFLHDNVGFPLEVLRWMHAAGCPIDWGEAIDLAQSRQTKDKNAVMAWLVEAAKANGYEMPEQANS